jgi:hypothetical protein
MPKKETTERMDGAAARLAMVGDLLIIAAYSLYSEADLGSYAPIIVCVDDDNRPKPISRQGVLRSPNDQSIVGRTRRLRIGHCGAAIRFEVNWELAPAGIAAR